MCFWLLQNLDVYHIWLFLSLRSWLTRIAHITWLTNSCKKQGTTGFFSWSLLLRITPSDQNDELSTLTSSFLCNKIKRIIFQWSVKHNSNPVSSSGANKGECAKCEWLVTQRKGPWAGESPFSPFQLSLSANLHWETDIWERGRFKSITTLFKFKRKPLKH